ncbi:succinyl-diaminopimelate desuccinylase [Nocardioides marinisabuli]|uniref:succinyl-diaminopimelate desuccinylase n=1 Tax=Nocardioides marinisabuli TaxID=419476 RepID=UPI002155956B|nr:succinyl-diaminopimelate desuccinylase [Nocardioides marinisabuli]
MTSPDARTTSDATPVLDLDADVVTLTRQLCDIESVSRDEQRIADAVQAALEALGHLSVTRIGHTVVARTDLGRGERVVLAGHLDTVPVNGNFPSRLDEGAGLLHGLGTCDMKGGDAVILRLAATVREPVRDVTFVLYEAEEIEEEHNGLKKVAEQRPDLLEADFAILMEPSNAGVEAGCQGTLRVDVRTTGERAHSARSWKGVNAIHGAADVLARLNAYEARRPVIDGLEYHEGLNAVAIRGGVAGTWSPTSASWRSTSASPPTAPPTRPRRSSARSSRGTTSRSPTSALPAMPGLDRPAAKEFVAAVGGQVAPKFGWTDVARFTALGVPAVNYGPGDPLFAHKADEHVPVAEIEHCERALRAWLTGGAERAGA